MEISFLESLAEKVPYFKTSSAWPFVTLILRSTFSSFISVISFGNLFLKYIKDKRLFSPLNLPFFSKKFLALAKSSMLNGPLDSTSMFVIVAAW